MFNPWATLGWIWLQRAATTAAAGILSTLRSIKKNEPLKRQIVHLARLPLLLLPLLRTFKHIWHLVYAGSTCWDRCCFPFLISSTSRWKSSKTCVIFTGMQERWTRCSFHDWPLVGGVPRAMQKHAEKVTTATMLRMCRYQRETTWKTYLIHALLTGQSVN